MPKQYLKFAALCFACIMLLCACSGGSGETGDENTAELPVLNVCMTVNAKQMEPASLLYDDAFLRMIEERIGAKIEISVMMDTEALNLSDSEILSGSFEGVAFITNPLSIVLLSDQALLYELDYSDRQRGFFTEFAGIQRAGRYHGRQYGLIFPSVHMRSDELVLVVADDILKEAGVSRIPATPDGFFKALRSINATGVMPLAAYASPNAEGFGILLALFGLVGNGEHEFSYENARVTYSKLSQEARSYIEFASKLYREGLLPKDFLSLTQYGAMMMLAEGKCAMSVFTDADIAQRVIDWAAKDGRTLSVARLPDGMTMGRTNSYKYLSGIITKDYAHTETALAFFDALAACSEMWNTAGDIPEFRTYPLFDPHDADTATVFEKKVDPVYTCQYSVRRLYEKRMLDSIIIEPFYGKLVTGELPIAAFESMAAQWHDAGGDLLIELYTRYYQNHLRGQELP